MKNLKKVFALLLALSLLSTAALAEGEEPVGTKKTGELDEMATTLDRTLSVEIVPEVAINDPGRIKLTVEWIQPSLTFTNKSIAYTALTKDGEGAYLKASDAEKLLAELKLDKEKEEDQATITALEQAVAQPTNPLEDVNYYLLGADKEVAFTLTNASVSSKDATFKGLLEIRAKTGGLDIKGIEGVLTTPTKTEQNEDGTDVTVEEPLQLKSKTTCAEAAEKIENDEEAKTKALNAYIDKSSYKYVYQNKADFLPGFTKEKDEEGNDTETVAGYYTATPKAEDVIKDLTTTVTFTVKAVQEKTSDSEK